MEEPQIHHFNITEEDAPACFKAYQGKTAAARWVDAERAFLALRAQVLSKEGWSWVAADEDQARALCFQLRNLAFGNLTAVLAKCHPDEWDDVTDICEQMVRDYATELRVFRILVYRAYWTFIPYRKRMTRAQLQQLFRCYCAFDYGNPDWPEPSNAGA